MEKHKSILSGKIQKAINATWDIDKRAKITSLKRLFLLNALAKSVMLYGVKPWGWVKRKQKDYRQHMGRRCEKGRQATS